MGEIAAKLADYFFITDDNPRTESSQTIFDDILKKIQNNKNYRIIKNRELAIKTAIKMCKANDKILIAGKGHEKTQVFATKSLYFSDSEVAQKYLKLNSGVL